MASSEEEDTLDSSESDLVGGIDEAEGNVVAAVEIDRNCRRHIQQSSLSLLFER